MCLLQFHKIECEKQLFPTQFNTSSIEFVVFAQPLMISSILAAGLAFLVRFSCVTTIEKGRNLFLLHAVIHSILKCSPRNSVRSCFSKRERKKKRFAFSMRLNSKSEEEKARSRTHAPLCTL